MMLGGCTAGAPEVEQTATNLNLPGVVWDNHPPTGEAENTQWAKEYRAQRIAEAAAYAYGDYSDPDLIAVIGYERAVEIAEWNQEHTPPHVSRDVDGTYRDDAPVRIRPQWEAIVEVVEHGDGTSATVVKCQLLWFGENYESQHDCQRVIMERDSNGVLIYGPAPGTSDRDNADLPLPASDDFPRAYWSEPIEAPTLPDRIKMPLPRSYYVDLGVIDG